MFLPMIIENNLILLWGFFLLYLQPELMAVAFTPRSRPNSRLTLPCSPIPPCSPEPEDGMAIPNIQVELSFDDAPTKAED